MDSQQDSQQHVGHMEPPSFAAGTISANSASTQAPPQPYQPAPPVLVTSTSDSNSTSVVNPVDQVQGTPPQPPPMQAQPLLHQQPQQQTPAGTTSEPANENNKEQQSQLPSPSPTPLVTPNKAVITKVKLTDELNLFDWSRTKELINQFAQRAKNSVESVMTTLDPGMKEYLYSGGNINIMVICDSESMVSPIRDAFQTVFGRATVVAARYDSSSHPVKLAHKFEGAMKIAKEKLSAFRNDTSNIPQNQVVVAIQPTLVHVLGSLEANRPFFTYAIMIDDPILGIFESCYSQLIPLDADVVERIGAHSFDTDNPHIGLGWGISIEEVMGQKLKIPVSDASLVDGNTSTDMDEASNSHWLSLWSGQQVNEIINRTSNSLAHMYQRIWQQCLGGDPA